MQAVLVCGGKGTRLMPRGVGPKSLVRVGDSTLLARLVSQIGRLHNSDEPPIVIVDAADTETPDALNLLLPHARIIRQAQPDGVANAVLLALPFIDDVAIVALGDLFLDGSFDTMPRGPALLFWRNAPPTETRKNFGISTDAGGIVSAVVEKPANGVGSCCGMGVYVLTRSAIACFAHAPVDARTGERGITSAIQTAIDAGVTFPAIGFSGFYSNINSHADVIAAERHLLRQPAR